MKKTSHEGELRVQKARAKIETIRERRTSNP